MTIPQSYHSIILGLDVNSHAVKCDFQPWVEMGWNDPRVAGLVHAVRTGLGSEFGRKEIVEFYEDDLISIEAKFMSAMIWGHEAPLGSRRDGRGPWKVNQMFSDWDKTSDIINSVQVSTCDEIGRSYKSFSGIPRCGANFFTKHFYFLGKAQGLQRYPVILDDRVARGVLTLLVSDQTLPSFVRASTVRKPQQYLEYLKSTWSEATAIGCEPDQIEYFLFGVKPDVGVGDISDTLDRVHGLHF